MGACISRGNGQGTDSLRSRGYGGKGGGHCQEQCTPLRGLTSKNPLDYALFSCPSLICLLPTESWTQLTWEVRRTVTLPSWQLPLKGWPDFQCNQRQESISQRAEGKNFGTHILEFIVLRWLWGEDCILPRWKIIDLLLLLQLQDSHHATDGHSFLWANDFTMKDFNLIAVGWLANGEC